MFGIALRTAENTFAAPTDMKRVSSHSKMLEDEADCIFRLLQQWQPSSFTLTEKAQERDLHAWLRKCLPDVPIVAQYGIAKGKADIVIQDSFVIELKLGFPPEAVAEFDRCVGQMERYRQKWVSKSRGPVYLVVVGDSDAEFRGLLHNWFEEVNGSRLTFFDSTGFYLVEKPSVTGP